MKFLRKEKERSQQSHATTTIRPLKNFINNTKIAVDKFLHKTPHKTAKQNVSVKEYKAIKDLKRAKITIKPADKNLGIVVMNLEDYIDQCLLYLSTDTYVRTDLFPEDTIRSLKNIIINFKDILSPHKKLNNYLQPNKNH